ncbi:MAG: choice-of-anchor J domain-containing protein [Fimbriimonadaceae bacterium]|nr:choice-of-anchor J domain-containing protein [Chitinophagales bacterium]
MKRIFTLYAVILLYTIAASAQRNCGTMEHDEMLRANDPNYAKNREHIEEFTQRYIEKNNVSGSRGADIITIPVVIHIVWKEDVENISESQALSQIEVMNEDFRRLNDDASDTPSEFEDVAADFEIEFCLATVDPDGGPTTGIERRETTVGEWNTDDAIKYTSEGGLDAWPADEYLNIWCGHLSPALLGYAQFPGGSPFTDGVVITYTGFGNEGTAVAPYNKGRTASHEIGHFLNLFHIWGDDADCTEPEDQCDDTPAQAAATFECPSYPYSDDCNESIQFMNYMDYSDDACYNMFTEDQKERARALFAAGGFREDLANSTKCVSYEYDAQCWEIISPAGTYCYDTFNPLVKIKNAGLVTITSLDINYSIDGGATSTYFWTGSLETGDYDEVSLPTISLPEGPHTISVNVSNPNGVTDEFADNNSQENDFVVNVAGFALPLIQGFEDAAFPYAGYTVFNPDGLWAWERTTLAAKTGASSVYINTFNISDIGEVDELILPAYNMTGLVSAHLDFDVANAPYSLDEDWADTLAVYVSTDCGITWAQIYKKYKPDLGTAPATGSNFVPSSTQWRTESVSLTPYVGDKLIVKFRSTSNWENNTFLDNININSGTVDIEDISAVNFTVYPIPANEFINISYYIAQTNTVTAEIYNMLGELILSEELKGSAGNNTTTLPVNHLAAGQYTIKLISGDKFAVNTFVKQ